MRFVHSIIRVFDLFSLGTCLQCARTAFGLMLISWISLWAALAAGAHVSLAAVAAVLLTLLWAGHIAGRAVRSTLPVQAVEGRRDVLRKMLGAAVGAAAASVAMTTPSRADSACGGWSGNNCGSGCRRCERQTTDCRCYVDRACDPC